MHRTEYCHILAGRIRIKVSAINCSHAMAGELERQLAKLNGGGACESKPTDGVCPGPIRFSGH